MFRQVIFFVIICLWGNNKIAGQQQGKFHSLSAALLHYSLKDASVEEKGLKNKGLGLSYQLFNEDIKRKTSIQVDWANVHFDLADGQSQVNDFSLILSDGFRVAGNGKGSFNAHIGYGIMVDPLYNKVKGKDKQYYTWNLTTNLLVYQSYNYSWKRQSVSLDVWVPLIGFSSRPAVDNEYADNMTAALYSSLRNPVFTSFHNNFLVNASAGYKKMMNKRWRIDVSVNYKLSDLKTFIPLQKRSLAVSAGLAWRML